MEIQKDSLCSGHLGLIWKLQGFIELVQGWEGSVNTGQRASDITQPS